MNTEDTKKDIEIEATTEPVGNYQISAEEELQSASNQKVDTPGEIDGYTEYFISVDYISQLRLSFIINHIPKS